MPALPELPRAWPSIDLPGYRELGATYADFAFDELPPIERDLDDELRWLLREPVVPESLAGGATPEQLEGLLAGRPIALPPAFKNFVALPDARARVRSCTDCYVELRDSVVDVEGEGVLVNFLSDSQGVLFWLLYSGPDGSEAVVATDDLLGFDEDDDGGPVTERPLDLTTTEAFVCADSFSTFLYRFWIENEIWFSLADPDSEPRPLTGEQLRYAEHYTRL